jgi:hypothetical protein
MKLNQSVSGNLDANKGSCNMKPIAFFVCWFASAIVLGFALFYVWDFLAKRKEPRPDHHTAER